MAITKELAELNIGVMNLSQEMVALKAAVASSRQTMDGYWTVTVTGRGAG